MAEQDDRRSFPRVPMMVKVRDGATGEERQYFSREISCGGLFLETNQAYRVGSSVHLEFQIPGSDTQVKVKADVMWTQKGGPRELAGVGLKFVDLDARSEELIAAYVEKLESIRRKLSV